ncbi:MAG TPA: class I SAM-dependent methyltransferase [bacterium]|mgnify:CR=1 FL=1|nr:class I SAM-dependent methyltransferase [bacterium]
MLESTIIERQNMSNNILFNIYQKLPQGPGCAESTEKAFNIISFRLPPAPSILDIGCGAGLQTIQLAELSNGKVTGIDIYKPFLEKLKTTAISCGYSNICTKEMSMFDINFDPLSFDLIWSECSIHIIGFKKGITDWKPFIKPNGFLVASDISWLKNNPPADLSEFWHKSYPDMNSVNTNMSIAEESGYENVEHFILPEKYWWDNYYSRFEMIHDDLEKEYSGNPDGLKIISEIKTEMELFKKYSDFYGCVFYVLKKN